MCIPLGQQMPFSRGAGVHSSSLLRPALEQECTFKYLKTNSGNIHEWIGWGSRNVGMWESGTCGKKSGCSKE